MTDDQIFEQAQRLPEEQRKPFLAEACGGNSAQMARLIELLEADQRNDSLLDPAVADSTLEHNPGTSLDMVGNYRLLQQIGEGGFGIVYMAEQTKPIRRKVAIKVVKPGMDSKAVLARFDAERQALAMMDHPNIATVFDGGVSDLGRPYFVMELVKGVPITTYCDDNHLGTRDRLRLFVDVCKAVQHAHTKGIIHRDIKPSNVLVTLHDGSPVVKVIDFGVAKAMHSQLTDQTLFTAFGQMIGTPQYMSPEQAEMSGLDVDTRSDVYSLGVMLYELLTGTTPLETDAIRGAGYVEMQRLIRETESPRPSARISSSADRLTHIAKHRSIDAKKLSDELRGDVDWIVMKALEKDRSRRYETAEHLARDVQNHLSDEIVSARPPSRRYRLQRYVRKQKTLLLTVATVVASLLLAVGILVYSLNATKRNAAVLKQERDSFRELLTEVAVTHALGGNLDEAKRMASEMYGPDAVAEKAFINGVAKFYGGDQPGAIESLEASCEADPANVAANAMLSIIYEWESSPTKSDVAWNRAKANRRNRSVEFHDELFFAYAQTYRQPDAAIQTMREIVKRRRSPIAQAQLAVLIGESMMGAESEEECRHHLETLASPVGPRALIENTKASLGRTNKWVEACDLFIRNLQLRLTLKTGGDLPSGFIDDTEDLIDRLPSDSKFPIYLMLKRIWYGLQGKESEDKLLQVLEDQGNDGRGYCLDHVRYLRSQPLAVPPLEPPETVDHAFRLLLHCHLDPVFRQRVRAASWTELLDNVENTRIKVLVLWLGLLTNDEQEVRERAKKILDRASIPTSEQRYYHVEPMLQNLAGELSDGDFVKLANTSRASQKVVFHLQLAVKNLGNPSRRAETLEQLDEAISANAPWTYSHFFARLLRKEIGEP